MSARKDLYVYDPEKHSRKADALGNPATDGRTYLTRHQKVGLELEDGTILEIGVTPGKDGIEIRNGGRTLSTGLAVLSHSSNVVRVVPYAY